MTNTQPATRRRFISVTAPVPAGDLIEFEVEGRAKDGSTFVEAFTCTRDVPPGALLGLTRVYEMDTEQGRIMVGLNAVDTFMQACLDTDDDRARWRRLLNDPSRHVEFQVLLDVAMWLAEELAARPTGQPPG